MKQKEKQKFIIKPQYPGGKLALQKFVQENLIYPKTALENKIEGTVFIGYKVDFDGKVLDAKIRNGIGHDCDEEAIRVVSMMKFAPQNNHGVKVSTQQKINIHFKLPIPQQEIKLPNAGQFQVNYSITTTKNIAKLKTPKTKPQSEVKYIITIG